MIKLTLRKPDGSTAPFEFENDALQSFLSEAAAADAVCEFVSLRGGGMAIDVTPKPKVDAPAPKGKVAGPGTVRETGTLRTPLQAQPKPEKK